MIKCVNNKYTYRDDGKLLLDTTAMDRSTIVLDTAHHYKYDVFCLVFHSRRFPSKTFLERLRLYFHSKLVNVVEFHRHTLQSMLTTRPISKNTLVFSFDLLIMCIRIECRDFYFYHELKPSRNNNQKIDSFRGKVHLSLTVDRKCLHTFSDISNGMGPGILIFSSSLSRSYKPITLSIANSPGIIISRWPFKNVWLLFARSMHK